MVKTLFLLGGCAGGLYFYFLVSLWRQYTLIFPHSF
jgi:hypothetical protein